jgi:hypothetical protein
MRHRTSDPHHKPPLRAIKYPDGMGSGRPAYRAGSERKQGVDVLVHCASSTRKPVYEVDVVDTQRLLEQARAAGVGHALYISITGSDQMQQSAYARHKLRPKLSLSSQACPTRFHGSRSSIPIRTCRCKCSVRNAGYRSCLYRHAGRCKPLTSAMSPGIYTRTFSMVQPVASLTSADPRCWTSRRWPDSAWRRSGADESLGSLSHRFMLCWAEYLLADIIHCFISTL